MQTLGNQRVSFRELPSWDRGRPSQLGQSSVCLPGSLEWLLGHMHVPPVVYKLLGAEDQ